MRPVVLLRAMLVRLGFLVGRVRPLRRRVLLATGHADRIGGNLMSIRNELRRLRPDIEIKIIAHRPWGGRWRRLGAVVHAFRSGYALATSRLVVVDDYFFPLYVVRPRTGTRNVQVWHACGALKKFGHSVSDRRFGADQADIRSVAIHSSYDLCLVSAEQFAPFYEEAFGLPRERFTARLGIPRTDLFFDEGRTIRARAAVQARFQIPAGRRVILYAPTFRGERATDARSPADLDLAVLQRELGADHVLLLRAHPFVVRRARLDASLDDFVIVASSHPDINELMLVSDVLITDYSSAMYEFALLGRPMIFFAPDLASYEAERGFYVDYRATVPGPICTTTEEVVAELRHDPGDLERVRRFAAESFDVADGKATRRFIDEVVGDAIPRPAVT